MNRSSSEQSSRCNPSNPYKLSAEGSRNPSSMTPEKALPTVRRWRWQTRGRTPPRVQALRGRTIESQPGRPAARGFAPRPHHSEKKRGLAHLARGSNDHRLPGLCNPPERQIVALVVDVPRVLHRYATTGDGRGASGLGAVSGSMDTIRALSGRSVLRPIAARRWSANESVSVSLSHLQGGRGESGAIDSLPRHTSVPCQFRPEHLRFGRTPQ